jgi:hypothetical protein
MERLNEETDEWEVHRSLYVVQLIPRRDISQCIYAWRKTNKYKRRSLIRRIENIEVSEEGIDNSKSFYERYTI